MRKKQQGIHGVAQSRKSIKRTAMFQAPDVLAFMVTKVLFWLLKYTQQIPGSRYFFLLFSHCRSGVGLNAGAYGSLLAGCECTSGRYPLTLAFLGLLSNMVQVKS